MGWKCWPEPRRGAWVKSRGRRVCGKGDEDGRAEGIGQVGWKGSILEVFGSEVISWAVG